MLIPNATLAVVPPDKVNDYLLSPSHPVGRYKARWLLSLGYDRSRPQQLADDLLTVVHSGTTFTTIESPFGVKYTVPGRILTPSGMSVAVVTVWIAESIDPRPRLVTAYPGRRKSHE